MHATLLLFFGICVPYKMYTSTVIIITSLLYKKKKKKHEMHYHPVMLVGWLVSTRRNRLPTANYYRNLRVNKIQISSF